MKDGYCDALNQMGIQSIKDGIIKIANKDTMGKNDNHIQELEKVLQQIQMSIKMENGYDATIKQIEDFISTVKSIEES